MKLKYISWLPAALLMICIFAFSSKPADTSNESSLTIAGKIYIAYEAVTNTQYEGAEKLALLEKINHIVRKCAHFSEYALLAWLLAFHLLVWHKGGKWLLIYPILIAMIYAMTDEYHQTFVVGRSGRITDVLIDTSGATTGAFLFLLIVVPIAMKFRNNLKLTSIQ